MTRYRISECLIAHSRTTPFPPPRRVFEPFRDHVEIRCVKVIGQIIDFTIHIIYYKINGGTHDKEMADFYRKRTVVVLERYPGNFGFFLRWSHWLRARQLTLPVFTVRGHLIGVSERRAVYAYI